MYIKYNYALTGLDYILAFDLALYKTGVSLYDIKNQKIIRVDKIEVPKNAEHPVIELYNLLTKYFEEINIKYGNKVMVVQEAMPQQAGKFTTVATLQGLAKAHAVLELCVDHSGLMFYDEKGIHSVSVKAMFRTEENQKPSKTDIKNKVCEYYNLKRESLTDDQSDSIALIYTLVNKKWNADIDTRVKELKKEIKSLKAEKTIAERQEEIVNILSFKL